MPTESRVELLLERWKAAEQQARDAEILLYRAYVDFASGTGSEPSEEMKQQATALRAEARSAYHAAMSEVDRVLDEADKRLHRP